ncbi:MAG: HAD family phosphatase [Lachnospiraceae bacterium]|nr:HAD family phosphatase [Lachnospiraceae bacterium]
MIFLFDMDGTVIDTEKYYRICWKQALSDFGYEMTDEQALSMRSLGRPFAPRRLKEYFGADADYDRIRSHRRALMKEMCDREGIEEKPGAGELLSYLKENGHIAAIATATDAVRSEECLKEVGLFDYITRIISAAEVKEGKPSPDIYLYACEVLGEKPEECFAVEDSPNGVTSAYLAGCKTIMIPDLSPADEELRPMLYREYTSLFELKKAIEEGKL